MQTSLGDKIADVLAPEGEMVTRWLAIVETVDSQGERWIRTLSTPDSRIWDNLGLLDYAHTYAHAAVAASYDD